MVTIPREAIKDQLEKLPADKNRLFDALKIEKLPHLLGRSGDDLNPTQMGEIHLFFLSVPAHTAAIAADEGYATGRADDLTRVLAGLPPQNIKDVTELPNICKTIGKLYVPRLIKKIQAQIAAAGVVNALALEGILKKRGAGEKLSSDETRLLLWSYAIGESRKQLASVPRDPDYCPDECKEIDRINELETAKSWVSCENKLARDPVVAELDWLLTDQDYPWPLATADFEKAEIIPPFPSKQETLEKARFDAQPRMPELRDALRLLATEGRELVDSDCNFPHLLKDQREFRTSEIEWAVNAADDFLKNKYDAMWWALDHAPFEFDGFYKRKKDIKKFNIPEETLRKFDEVPTLLEEIQTAYCFGRPATVAALARAVLERIMKTHKPHYEGGLGKYKGEVFSDDKDAFVRFNSDDDEKRVQDAMDKIYKFGNEILHAETLKQKSAPQKAKELMLGSQETIDRMEAVCTVHLPAIIELFLPLITPKPPR